MKEENKMKATIFISAMMNEFVYNICDYFSLFNLSVFIFNLYLITWASFLHN